MVPIDKVVEIYNTQNSDHIRRSDDESVTIYRDHFVYQVIIDCGEFESMLEEKAGKPYYIPPEDELFRYADYLYFEKTWQYTKLFEYVKMNFFGGDDIIILLSCTNQSPD